jgi:hypothetical protein
MAMIAALMHDRHAAELAVEGDAGVEVADMEGDMGEGRRHGVSLPGTAKRCIKIVARTAQTGSWDGPKDSETADGRR